MPTKEPRLNVVLDKDTRDFITYIASKRHTTSSKVAADLINEALELAEDKYWSDLAEKRERETTEWIPHDEFWKQAKKKLKK